MAGAVRRNLIRFRDHQINFLFHHLGPNLKIMTALIEFKHLLAKHQAEIDAGTLVKDRDGNMTPMTRERVAEMTAAFTNADFGGLNLAREGHSPTVPFMKSDPERPAQRRSATAQHLARLLLLAPDWTESNVQTLWKTFPGLNRDKAERSVYQQMWARVFLRAGAAIVLFNYLMSLGDDDDFAERYQKAWKSGRLRWLDVDITPIARKLGADADRRTYFSLLGHFKDPIKWLYNDKPGERDVVLPTRAMKHKASILVGPILEAAEGSDWADRPFTTWREFFGIDDKGIYQTTRAGHYRAGQPKGGKDQWQTVAFRWGGADHSVGVAQIPSFVLNQAKGVLPIPVQNLTGFAMGEMDMFSAWAKSLGFATGQAREE